MTQQLADALIKHYEDSVEDIRGMESIEDVRNMLTERSINRGICHCSICVFDEPIYNDIWVYSQERSIYDEDYWFVTPSMCDTISEILSSLQFRIDRLKTFKETI